MGMLVVKHVTISILRDRNSLEDIFKDLLGGTPLGTKQKALKGILLGQGS
jgi:hypothetical protein